MIQKPVEIAALAKLGYKAPGGTLYVNLEPCTHHVGGNQAARDDGSMVFLEHGQERRYTTTFRVGEL